MPNCVAHLIVEYEIKIEQNWGTNADEDQGLLTSLSSRTCLTLFEVRMAPINTCGLNSNYLGASQVISRTNPQPYRGVSVFYASGAARASK